MNDLDVESRGGAGLVEANGRCAVVFVASTISRLASMRLAAVAPAKRGNGRSYLARYLGHLILSVKLRL
jgi:hypothetical protein